MEKEILAMSLIKNDFLTMVWTSLFFQNVDMMKRLKCIFYVF